MGAASDDMKGEIELAPGVTVSERDITFTFSRSGGPGGQAVNKVATRATMRVPVESIQGLSERAAARLRSRAGRRLTKDDEIVMHAWSERSQLLNKRACVERLSGLVTEAIKVPKPRKKKRVTRAMKRRTREAKEKQSEKKSRRRWEAE